MKKSLVQTVDFPGGPVAKTLPFSVGGSIPGREAKIPHTSVSKNQNIKKKKKRSNIVTDSIKTLKMVHIKKKKNL